MQISKRLLRTQFAQLLQFEFGCKWEGNKPAGKLHTRVHSADAISVKSAQSPQCGVDQTYFMGHLEH